MAEQLVKQAKVSFDQAPDLPEIHAFELQEKISVLAYQKGEYDKAQSIIDPLILRIETLLSKTLYEEEKTKISNLLVEVLLQKSHISVELGKIEESLEVAKKALSMALQLGNNYVGSLEAIYTTLGHTYRELFDFENSEKMLLLAAENAEKSYGEFNLKLASIYNQLASTYINMDKLDESIPYAEKGYEIRTRLFPNGHVEIAASLGILSQIYSEQENYPKAIEYRLLMSELLEKLFGKEHHYVGGNALSLAGIYISNEQYDEAEQQLQFGASIIKEQLPEGSVFHAMPLVYQGKVHFYRNDYSQAIQTLEQAIQVVEKTAPTGHWMAGESYTFIALSKQKLGEIKSAQENKALALSSFEALFGKDNSRYKRLDQLLKDI